MKFTLAGSDAVLSQVLAADYPQSAPVSCTAPPELTSRGSNDRDVTECQCAQRSSQLPMADRRVMDRQPRADRQARRRHLPPGYLRLRITRAGPATVPRPQRTAHGSLALLLGLALLGMMACGRVAPPPGTGDPGNRRLDLLSRDGAFASLPVGAAPKGPLTKAPARYRTPGFQPPGSDGPSVMLAFTSARSAASVFSFFQASAAAAGWYPGNRNTLGYPQTWTKTYQDGVAASLYLIQIVRAHRATGTYLLTASSPPLLTH